MSTRLSVFALSAILIASIGMSPAFGQIIDPIAVTTDKPSYAQGETILVSGEVRDLIGQAVSVMVISPNGSIVSIAQLEVGSDKRFSTELVAGGTIKFDGTYTIKVTYGGQSRTAETTFDFGSTSTPSTPSTPSGPSIAVPGTEFSVGYSITGGSILSISPDVDANSLVIGISTTGDGEVTITLPRGLIDAKIGSEDDDFFVLVDGEEIEFEETATKADRILTINFPAGAEEIEIIGTMVVPEFGTIAALILAVAIISIVAVSARSRLSIMPKY